MFNKVDRFNKEIIGINRELGPIEDKTEFDWFIGALKEEIQELEDAYKSKDFIGQIDAVMDLIYFAAGGPTRMGMPPSMSTRIFSAINDCNMNKRRGVKEGREVQHENDAIKPEGWVAPEEKIMEILTEYENHNRRG